VENQIEERGGDSTRKLAEILVARSKSSGNWLREHEDDEFVKRSRQDGYRSRASYKLIEIQAKHQLIKKGMRVVDLGAAPGGWSQVVMAEIGNTGRLIALDLLQMDPIEGVEIIQGDFTENEVLEQLLKQLSNQKFDLVLSDMAPNLSGMREIDLPKSIYLMELALDFAGSMLNSGGSLLVKGFQGEGIDGFRATMKSMFSKVKTCKPRASRDRSREFYLLGVGLK
jgi:23S rRNA (uridine2552-2'-O)-methyltransferase